MNTERSSAIAPTFPPPPAAATASSTSITTTTATTTTIQGNSQIRRAPSNTNSNLQGHRQRTIPRLKSNLSAIDSKFIELTRCLYQAKAIVQDLSSFYDSVLPALSLSTYHEPALPPQKGAGSVAFLHYIKQYLDDNFIKFTRLCKVLIMILSRLEQSGQVKLERVQSFRNEIMEEWRIASDIKRRIQTYLHQNNSLFDGSSGNMPAFSTSHSADQHQQSQQQQQQPTTAANQVNTYRNISTHLFPTVDQQQFQHQQSPSLLYGDPTSSHHAYHHHNPYHQSYHHTGSVDTHMSTSQAPAMTSVGMMESMGCSDSPTTQIGSPTSTVSG
ncbi:hypothetical protein BC941DRAFT_430600 [Chlamydoabsidia padenii]|nr:hypothetical protein BC941DRAFT_430600 [Chlamydoabsidia padenii]